MRQETTTPVTMPAVASHADAAKKAMPAVVNIYTSKDMRQRARESFQRTAVADEGKQAFGDRLVFGVSLGRE